MKERPILFSGPMVCAILEGRKTQTRRIIKGVGPDNWLKGASNHVAHAVDSCPYGINGDRLWVRETHAIVPRTAYSRSIGVKQVLKPNDNHDAAVFRAGLDLSPPGRWRPSIHMPRWASRITLEITDVRVQRLQDISEEDAKNEGASKLTWDGEIFYEDDIHGSFKCGFAGVWTHINGADNWDSNPWVWVVEFKRV